MIPTSTAKACAAALVMVLAATAPASGQVTLDVKNALSVGGLSSSEAGLEVRPAWSLEASLGFGLSPSLSVFGGYARTQYGCNEGFCTGRELTVSGSHGILGLEFNRGAPFARVGLMYGKTGVSGADNAEAGLGVKLGVGGSFGGSVRIRPGISFSVMDAGSADSSATASAFSLELGVLIPIT